MAEQRYSVALEGGRLAYIGRWEFPEGRYENYRLMQAAARDGLAKFNARKSELANDERLTDIGRKEALDQEFKAFQDIRERFMSNAVRTRLPTVLAELQRVGGPGQRDKADAAGAVADAELRSWYRSLAGSELTEVNRQLRDGAMPDLANAIARMPREVSGARSDIHEISRRQAVDPRHEEQVAELRAELSAIRFAENAMNVATVEMHRLGGDLPSVKADISAVALAAEGLEKTSAISVGEHVPEVGELEKVDGVFDESNGAEHTTVVDKIVSDAEGNARVIPTRIAVTAPKTDAA
jgi:hypothetical protein